MPMDASIVGLVISGCLKLFLFDFPGLRKSDTMLGSKLMEGGKQSERFCG